MIHGVRLIGNVVRHVKKHSKHKEKKHKRKKESTVPDEAAENILDAHFDGEFLGVHCLVDFGDLHPLESMTG